MKKQFFTYAILGLFSLVTTAQTITENYVQTTSYRTSITDGNQSSATDDQKIQTIVYFDGLGRPIQSRAHRAGGDGLDIVSMTLYDGQGRQTKQYLPLGGSDAGTTGSLNMQSYEDLFADLGPYYQTKFPGELDATNPNVYSETRYDNSPLNRPLEQGAPGLAWEIDPTSDSDHTIKFEYANNDINEVKRYYVTTVLSGDNYVPTLVDDYYYPKDVLYKNIIKDENWKTSDGDDKTTQEFKNTSGQVVLKRTFNNTLAHDTYYVYDDFGNLTFVLPPKVDTSDGVSATELDDLSYQYVYDTRNRLTEKKIPGKDWEYIIYDQLDRPVLTQDGNLRANDQWLFTKYDRFGRVAYTGLYTEPTLTRSSIGGTIGSTSNPFETQGTSATTIGDVGVYYSNGIFPTSNLEVLTINYYDTYIDIPTAHINLPTTPIFGVTHSSDTHGLPTVSKVRILDTQDWITSFSTYDEKGRVIQTASYNAYLDTTDESQMNLDFTGQVLNSWSSHIKGTNPAIITNDYFTYDHQGRLLTHLQDIDNGGLELIAENTYDELGQLEKKKVGGELFASGYTDLVKVAVSETGRITKTEGGTAWNAGLATIGKIMDDGGLSFSVFNIGEDFLVGLNDINTTAYVDDVTHGFLFKVQGTPSEARVVVKANGSNVSSTNTTYAAGDTFAVERAGDTLYFYHNGTLVHSELISGLNPPLLGDMSLKTMGAGVDNLHFYATTIDKVLQEVDYTYNIRGWMKEINPIADLTKSDNTDLFSFKLNYTNIEGDAGTSAIGLYNGNIAQTIWQTENDNIKRGYAYSYDDLNRITKAVSREGVDLTTQTYNTVQNITYDTMGNILTLDRRGRNLAGTSSPWWDKLVYGYDGNQLKVVTDNATSAGGKDLGFYDGANTFTEYTYDVNGNMLSDANKGITSITYNHLNLPKQVTLLMTNSGHEKDGTITYAYDANGVKQKKTVVDNLTSNTTVTDYAGGFVYTDDTLEFISQPEGYVFENNLIGGGTELKYVFQYKDHLGNIRLSYSDANGDGSVNSGEIVEESHYYPFGLKQNGYNNTTSGGNDTAQNWKFQGQELSEDLELNMYEFKYRMHDPSIGRFIQVDPLAEDYVYNSTYAFSENRVIDSYEREGLERFFAADGSQIGLVGDSNEIRVMNDSSSDNAQSQITDANNSSLTAEERAEARSSLMQGSSQGYRNTDEAAKAFALANTDKSVESGIEYGAIIKTIELSTGECGDCSIIEGTDMNTVALLGPTVEGDEDSVSLYDMKAAAKDIPGELSAMSHTHPNGSMFSLGGGGVFTTDESLSKRENIPVYMSNRNRKLYRGDFNNKNIRFSEDAIRRIPLIFPKKNK